MYLNTCKLELRFDVPFDVPSDGAVFALVNVAAEQRFIKPNLFIQTPPFNLPVWNLDSTLRVDPGESNAWQTV
jgi:hypothetical protein